MSGQDLILGFAVIVLVIATYQLYKHNTKHTHN